MIRLAAALVFSLAASCSFGPVGTPAQSHPAWMTGEWVWVNPTVQIEDAGCGSASEYYGRNGYVMDGDYVAKWWIEGDTLVRVVIEDALGTAPGTIYRDRITRNGPKELTTTADGYPMKALRCGDTPPEWQYRIGK